MVLYLWKRRWKKGDSEIPMSCARGWMKLLLLAVPALTFPIFPPAEASGSPWILHHDLAVTLHPDNGTLSGVDTLTIRTDGVRRLSLVLAKGAVVTRVDVAGKPIPLKTLSLQDGKLEIPVAGEPLEEELAVAVGYEAAFRDPVPENPLNTEEPGYGVTGSISGRGIFLSSEAGWYPDIPGSAATFRVRVEAPEGVESVTAGKPVGRKTVGGATVSEWETASPLPEIALSAGRYRVRERVVGGLPILTYLLQENEALSDRFLDASAKAIDLFQGLFGPYPFEKFAVVENFIPTGYAYPSYTLLGSSVLRLPFVVETSLGHEIAHSWWGNGVRVDSRRGNWSEGLATYVADHLFKERSSAADGKEYRRKLLEDYATLVPPRLDFPLKDFKERDSPATRAVGYGKGAMVFHMARKEVGDDLFWSGLRSVVREKLGREASWDDFDRALPRERSADPASFFRQWVDRPGAPVIALKDAKAARDGDRWKVTGRVVQEKPYYEILAPLRLETAESAVDASVPLAGAEARFTIFCGSPPARLILDPNVDLFRRFDPSEIPPTVNGVRGSESLLVVAARNTPPGVLDASKTLLAALGKESAPVLREEETSPRSLAGRDVLYIGLPSGTGYLPPFPKEVSATPDRFTLEGLTYASASDALFAAFPHPSDKGRVAALFLPLSAEAAAKAGRKIPHYGKYGYLSFSDGVNKAKGRWTAAASRAVQEFPQDAR